jgi:hypothetical protein
MVLADLKYWPSNYLEGLRNTMKSLGNNRWSQRHD